jgi:hypothetical protein
VRGRRIGQGREEVDGSPGSNLTRVVVGVGRWEKSGSWRSIKSDDEVIMREGKYIAEGKGSHLQGKYTHVEKQADPECELMQQRIGMVSRGLKQLTPGVRLVGALSRCEARGWVRHQGADYPSNEYVIP